MLAFYGNATNNFVAAVFFFGLKVRGNRSADRYFRKYTLKLIKLFILDLQTRDALFFGLFNTTLGCYFAFHYEWIQQKIGAIRTRYFVTLCLLFSVDQIVERLAAITWGSGEKDGENYYLSTIPLTVCFFYSLKKGFW